MNRLDKERLTFLEETSRDYEMSLMSSPGVLSYLHGRGVSIKSVDRFRLGLAEDPPPEHARFAGRLAIPIIKKAGVVGFKFRCVRPECRHEGHAKYITGDPQSLYNVDAVDRAEDYLALVEGESDTWILDGECDIPTSGVPSVTCWKPHFKRLLKDIPRIYFFRDMDVHLKVDVGLKLAEKVQQDLPQTIIIDLPVLREGEKSDVTEVFCARGRGFIRGLIGEA